MCAQHLYGAPAADHLVSAYVNYLPMAFTPEGWNDYSFGDPQRKFKSVQRSLGKGTLDENGNGGFRIKAPKAWRPAAAIKAVISGTVQELGGRSVTAYAGKVIDFYPYYIGLKKPGGAVDVGETSTMKSAIVRPDEQKNTTLKQLTLSIEKLTWTSVLKKRDGRYYYASEEQAIQVETREVPFSKGEGTIEFQPALSGKYRLSLHDSHTDAATSVVLYAREPGQHWVTRSLESPDLVELQLDKKHYLSGETAVLSIRAPFPGKMLLTLETNHVLEHRVIELKENSTEIKLPTGSFPEIS